MKIGGAGVFLTCPVTAWSPPWAAQGGEEGLPGRVPFTFFILHFSFYIMRFPVIWLPPRAALGGLRADGDPGCDDDAVVLDRHRDPFGPRVPEVRLAQIRRVDPVDGDAPLPAGQVGHRAAVGKLRRRLAPALVVVDVVVIGLR